MYKCPDGKRDMLPNPISINTGLTMIDFETARRLADKRAREIAAGSMLVSWYDRKTGKASPQTICCSYDKPDWLVYALSRGATIAVDINDEEYVFMYHAGT
ncbi:MAG: AF1514 family protein [Desulfomonile sp.]|nr:AF1514 family protein [Desulfomonile sp.]